MQFWDLRASVENTIWKTTICHQQQRAQVYGELVRLLLGTLSQGLLDRQALPVRRRKQKDFDRQSLTISIIMSGMLAITKRRKYEDESD